MKRITLLFGLLALPVSAFALNYTDATERYTDAPFSTAESAGISLLTNIGAVSGNPDGSFAAERTLNRAEFLKIVLASDSSIAVSSSDAENCFPDVTVNDWFSKYVCFAKARGYIAGYPDGFFRPANTVNYAEALKILVEMYDYTLPTPSPTEKWAWYTAYLRAANEHGVSLPGNVDVATLLTRGQMARLAAAFVAESEGELTLYRAAERGQTVSSSSSNSSSMSSASSESSASSVSSLSSSSLSSSSSVSTLYPAVSRFLLAGRTSPVILDGTFTASDEDSYLRFVDILLRKEVKSLKSMTLVDPNGTAIGTLTLSTDNNTDNRKWKADLGTNGYKLLKGVPTKIGIKANLKTRAEGAVANEFMDGIETWSVIVSGVDTNASKQIVPTDTHYPQHQTTDARLTAVRNDGQSTATMVAGSNKVIGTFALSGEVMTGGVLNLASLDFNLQSTDVTVSNIRIGGPSPVQQMDCGIDSVQMSHVTCSVIPEDFREIGATPEIITVYGDVSLRAGVTQGMLQMVFGLGRGKIGQNGSVKWKDSAGTYNWLEASTVLENGTVWTVTGQ